MNKQNALDNFLRPPKLKPPRYMCNSPPPPCSPIPPLRSPPVLLLRVTRWGKQKYGPRNLENVAPTGTKIIPTQMFVGMGPTPLYDCRHQTGRCDFNKHNMCFLATSKIYFLGFYRRNCRTEYRWNITPEKNPQQNNYGPVTNSKGGGQIQLTTDFRKLRKCPY